MRHHAIKFVEENRNMLDAIVIPPYDFEENQNNWLLVPESGDAPFVLNDYGLSSRFPDADRKLIIQLVS